MPADVVKHVSMTVGESRKSTDVYPQGYNELRANVNVWNHSARLDDDYTTGYGKRLNYWLKEENTQKIMTQGTIYSWTDRTNTYVSYTVSVPYVNGQYRLYVEAPNSNVTAHGELTMFQ
ncbi:hypothetical protein Bfsp1_20 [Cytobacillus phage Bfsp1]|nr:hypothetical protein Bfsp1_20 [Cytobacillus phage Bfsp1]